VLNAQVPPWATLNGAKASPAYLVPTGQILTLRGDGVPYSCVKPVSYVDESGKVKVQVCVATSSAVTIRNAEGAIIAWSTSENTTEKSTWGESVAAEWQVFSTQPPFAGEQPTASFENVHGHLWGTIKRYSWKEAGCFFNYNLHLVAPGTKSVEPQASYYARETGYFPGAVTVFLSNLSGPIPVALKHDRNARAVSVGDGADTLLALVMLFVAVRDRQKHDS